MATAVLAVGCAQERWPAETAWVLEEESCEGEPGFGATTGGDLITRCGTRISRRARHDGELIWRVDLFGSLFAKAAAVIPGGDVYLLHDNILYRFSAADGSVLWQVDMPGPFLEAGIVAAGEWLVTAECTGDFTADCSIAFRSAADGTPIWTLALGMRLELLDLAANADVIVTKATYPERWVARYRASDGQLVWEADVDPQDEPRQLVTLPDGGVVLCNQVGDDVAIRLDADGARVPSWGPPLQPGIVQWPLCDVGPSGDVVVAGKVRSDLYFGDTEIGNRDNPGFMVSLSAIDGGVQDVWHFFVGIFGVDARTPGRTYLHTQDQGGVQSRFWIAAMDVDL